MFELNSPRPLFEAPPGRANWPKHWLNAVQTTVPNLDPMRNLCYSAHGQGTAERLPVLSAYPRESPHFQSPAKKPLSEKDDVPGNSREHASKGTFATTEGFEQQVALPFVGRPPVSCFAKSIDPPQPLSPLRHQFASVALHSPATAH